VLSNKWEFVLTPEIVDRFTVDVFPHIELDIMRGQVTKQPDGRTRYIFTLDDEATRIIKSALINTINQINGRCN
jgi:hypothetical protein